MIGSMRAILQENNDNELGNQEMQSDYVQVKKTRHQRVTPEDACKTVLWFIFTLMLKPITNESAERSVSVIIITM